MVPFVERICAHFGTEIHIPRDKRDRLELVEELRMKKIIGKKTTLASFLRQLNHYGFQRNLSTNEYVHKFYPEQRERITRGYSSSSTPKLPHVQKTKKRTLGLPHVRNPKKQRLDKQTLKELNSFNFNVPKPLPEFTNDAFALDPACYEKAFRFYKKNMHAYDPRSRILFI